MSRMILLADDSITIQKIVNLTFSGEGIDVITVGNGDAALKKIHEHRPSLVLADIFMPGKNGYEVCEAIKNDPELQSIPVILLVGAFEPFDSHEADRVKADSHLTKPFEIKALISAVRTLIEAAEQKEIAKTEPQVVTSDTVVEVEEAAEPAHTQNFETVEEPIIASPPPASLQEEALHITEPKVIEPTEVEVSEEVPVDVWVPEVVPEDIPKISSTKEPAVLPELSLASTDTTFVESVKIPLPVIEETDPLGLECGEDGLGLASLPLESIPDTKSMVVEIWEAADVSAIREPASSTAEVLRPSFSEIEPERSEAVISSEPFTEEVHETFAKDEEVGQTVIVPPGQPSESVQDVPVMQAVTSVAPLNVTWGEKETAELVNRIANKVVERLSREVIEKIAWEVIPDMAVLMIKDQVESHFKTTNDR